MIRRPTPEVREDEEGERGKIGERERETEVEREVERQRDRDRDLLILLNFQIYA